MTHIKEINRFTDDVYEPDFEIEMDDDTGYNEAMKFIDYDNSILSVSSSILKHYGCDPYHKTLDLLDEKLEANPRNVVLVLLDGMGVHSLEKLLPPKAFMRQHLCGTISSVFPSTTVAATTSVLSGLSPIEHGRLGWYLYYNEANDNVTVFGNICQTTGKKASDVNLADKYMPYKSIIELINENSDAMAYEVSPFSKYNCKSSAEVFKKAADICNDGNRNFIYCYWPNPDADMHNYGTESFRAEWELRELDSQIEKLCSQVEDTTVIVIADHGLVDVEWDSIQNHPMLNAMMEHKPSIERRASAIFLNDGLQELFAREFRNEYGDRELLMTKEEALEEQIFGPGEPNPMVDEFLGDFMAISVDKLSIEGQKGDSEMRASHGGLTEEEMIVPLIIIEK